MYEVVLDFLTLTTSDNILFYSYKLEMKKIIMISGVCNIFITYLLKLLHKDFDPIVNQ